MSIYLYGVFDCIFLSCIYAIQSEFKLYSCLSIKELLAQNRRQIWSLSNCNWNLTQNLLIPKVTLNRLAQLAEQLNRVKCTYLYGAFDCMFLSCHVRISE